MTVSHTGAKLEIMGPLNCRSLSDFLASWGHQQAVNTSFDIIAFPPYKFVMANVLANGCPHAQETMSNMNIH